MVTLRELVDYINSELDVGRFRDYCPNGLQVEGNARVSKIAFQQRDLVPEMFDVLGPAPPPDNPVDIHTTAGKAVVGEMASRETGDSRNQHLHTAPFERSIITVLH